VSDAGRVEVRLHPGTLGDLTLEALTSSGIVRTNAPQQLFDDRHFTIGLGPDGTSRDWRGIRSNRGLEERHNIDVQRLHAVLSGTDRSTGLDVISRAGTVVVTFDK